MGIATSTDGAEHDNAQAYAVDELNARGQAASSDTTAQQKARAPLSREVQRDPRNVAQHESTLARHRELDMITAVQSSADGYLSPGRESRWFPSENRSRVLKGARTVDSIPRKPKAFRSNSFADASVSNVEELSSHLFFLTRAGVESEHAQLSASVGAARALHDTLGRKVRSMREMLARGDVGNGALDDTDEGLAGAHQGLLSHRMQIASLEAELDRYRDKIRAHISVSDRQRGDMTTLVHDSTVQCQRASAARKDCGDARERLQKCRHECAELHRKAKTEQLRVVMLREAFEKEQTRVGVSLGRAEAFVSDLVAATEGTRRVEAEEQTLARECVSARSEIHAAEAQDEFAAESEIRRLRRDLHVAESTLANNSAATMSAAASANLQSECHVASSQLTEAKRRCQGVSLIALRCLANEAELRQSTEVLEEEAMSLSRQIKSAQQELSPSLQLEEVAQAALRQAEAKIAVLLSEAQQIQAGRKRSSSPGAGVARQCATEFSRELEAVKAELSERTETSVPLGSSGLQDADWRLDLEAAGLQRKLGRVLATERNMYCELLETHLQRAERKPEDGNESAMLQHQVQVLRRELQVKDAEIDRLSKSQR